MTSTGCYGKINHFTREQQTWNTLYWTLFAINYLPIGPGFQRADNTAWIHLQHAGMMNSLLSGCCGPHLFQPSFISFFFFFRMWPAYLLEEKKKTQKTVKQESVMELQLAVCFKQRFLAESRIRMIVLALLTLGWDRELQLHERCACICHSWMPRLQAHDSSDSSVITCVDRKTLLLQ